MNFTMNRRRWIGLSLAGVAGAGALGALFAAPALGGGGGWLGHGGGRFGHHGRHHFDESDVREHVEWILRDANATDAQVDEITRIATATAQDLRGLREGARGAHDEIAAALGGESVDRAALEALRAEHLAAAETASRKLTDALAQVAEVLTPEQRKVLIEQHAKRRARHGHE
jgi:Spy/CpxP family protein refolding chaperone